jgi:Raf kinase inhibitor-like YbhB/YbcL family protein
MRNELALCFVAAVFLGCQNKEGDGLGDTKGVPTMELTSTAFPEAGTIPEQYTGDGQDISPPLEWKDAPEQTKSYALICDDPDAPRGTWVHWVLFNLPATQHELAAGLPVRGQLSDGAKQGKNDFGKIGYGGPAPPRGKPHRYFFKLYAVDTIVDLPEGATKQHLEQALKGHILAQGQLMGKYAR